MFAIAAGPLTGMVGEYMTEKTGAEYAPGTFQAMIVCNDNKDMVAGVVFNNFRKTDVEVSCASDNPAAWRPNVCAAIFKYAFDQLGCVRCTSITTKGNKKARSFLESLGFVLEGNIRLGYDGRRDALIYGLLRSECRFLADWKDKGNEQQEQQQPADRAGPDRNGEHPVGVQHDSGGNSGEPEPYHAEQQHRVAFVFPDGNEF